MQDVTMGGNWVNDTQELTVLFFFYFQNFRKNKTDKLPARLIKEKTQSTNIGVERDDIN